MEIEGIGLFNDGYLPILDGVSITVRNYALWLNRKVATTIVVTPHFPGHTDSEEFRVLRYLSVPLPFHTPYRVGLPFMDPSIFKSIMAAKLDLVHAHSPFSAGTLALKAAREKGIPIVATFHSKYREDFEAHIPNKNITSIIIKRIVNFYESVDEVWIPQNWVEEPIRSYGYKGKLEVVANGIDLDPVMGIDSVRAESRQALGFGDNELIFLYVGQHILEKNLKFLLEALKHFDLMPYRMLLVGSGYAKSMLEGLAQELGIEHKLTFYGAVHDRKELSKLYASANLFLFPSLYDNAPLVLREAAAMHTPSLLLKGSTASEVIEDGVNGFLSENNVEAYADKIAHLCANPDLIRKAGLMASQTLCRSWESVVDEVKDRYQSLVARHKYK